MITLKVKTPRVPNFVSLDFPPTKREDGFKELPTVPVGDLSDEQLNQLCEEWKADLFEVARKQRAQGKEH